MKTGLLAAIGDFITSRDTYAVVRGRPGRGIKLELRPIPLLNSGKVELLGNDRLIGQLVRLGRRAARSGKDSVDHPPHAHDDLINAAAGVLVRAQAPVVLDFDSMLVDTGFRSIGEFDIFFVR